MLGSPVAASTVNSAQNEVSNRLTLLPLVALVVGSMTGGGVFSLLRDMSRGPGPGASLLGWAVIGVGVLMPPSFVRIWQCENPR